MGICGVRPGLGALVARRRSAWLASRIVCSTTLLLLILVPRWAGAQNSAPDHEFRDPRVVRLAGLITAARDRVNQGQVTDGLDRLQIVLDQSGDTFYRAPGSSRSVSLRRHVALLFHSLTPEVHAAYERRFGADAARLLRTARDTRDTAKLVEVMRRYFFTRAGFEAADEMATRYLDRGWYQLSAPLWLRLVTTPAHAKRLTNAVLLKSHLAFGRVGWTDHATTVTQLLKQRKIQFGGRLRSLESWQDLLGPPSALAAGLHWQLALGNIRHNPNSQSTTPQLRPLWVLNYERNVRSDVAVALREWQDEQLSNDAPLAVANFAIAVGDTVLFRDSRQIKAVDATTGRTRWNYHPVDSHTSVFREVNRNSGTNYEASKLGHPFVDSVRAYVGNAGYGMLSSDGQRVYFIDAADLKTYRPGNWNAVRDSQTNRLVAVDVIGPRKSPDGRVEPAWTLGGQFGVPFWFERDDVNLDRTVDPSEFHGTPTEFQNWDRDSDGQLTVEESRTDRGASAALEGHLFLGPPLAAAGMLYAVTAFHRQINVTCIEAETGQVVWSQGIGFLRGATTRNIVLGMLVSTPALADGVLVCPTQADVLVGVDPVNGTLLWSYDQSDVDQATRNAGFQVRARVPFGHLGFPGLPLIDDGRVVCLPRHSRWVHCIDLVTGERRWRVARDSPHQTGFAGNGDEYVAAVADGRVLLVGRRNCRALSLADGRQLWSTYVGTPSGRGVRSGRYYLLPLQDGRVYTLDLETGSQVGFSLPMTGPAVSQWTRSGPSGTATRLPYGWQPGNLMIAGRNVISVGHSLIAAFPQSQQVLDELNQRLSHGASRAVDVSEAAELELAMGRLSPAKQRLDQALQLDLTWQQRRHVQTMLREVLHLELDATPDDYEPKLQRLQELSQVPRDRARYLFRASAAYLHGQDTQKLVEAVDELTELSSTTLWEHPQDLNLRQTHQGWIPSVLRRAAATFQQPAADNLSIRLDQRLYRALASNSVEDLEAHLSITSQLPQAAQARRVLAERLELQGRYQQAELLLLHDAGHADDAVSGPALAGLVRLWDAVGLYAEAARVFERLETDFAAVDVAPGLSGRAFTESPMHSAQLRTAVLQRKPIDWKVRRVGIFQRSWYQNDPAVHNAFVGIRSSKFPLPSENGLLVFDKGTDQQPRLAIINKQAGRIVGHVDIPQRMTPALGAQQVPVGHFFSAVSRTLDDDEQAAILGISLLNRRNTDPLWTRSIDPDGGTLRAGPSGPGFAVFQAADRLLVVDPADGRPLWERRNLPVNGGLVGDPYAGVFGDERVLVMFDSNRTDCTIFRTQSGEVVGQARLTSGRRIVFGRRLFYESREHGQKRFRIWDPLHGKTELDLPVFEPQIGRSFCAATDVERHLAMIVEPCTLLIRDVAQGRNVLSVPLNPADLQGLVSNGLSVFSDRERWFVAFRFEDRLLAFPASPNEHRRAATLSSGFQSFTPVNGELRALDRRSGRPLWRRRFAARSFLHTPFTRLPFLISLARLTDRRQTRAMIAEVVDAQTGRTLGFHDGLAPDKFFQIDYQPAEGVIEFQGVYSRVRMNFSRGFQRLYDEPQ